MMMVVRFVPLTREAPGVLQMPRVSRSAAVPVIVSEKMISIARPDIGEAEESAVIEVLRSGMIAMGARTEALEVAWAQYCGVRHAVFMANGTVATEAILRASGIGPGDEVITVSFTFNATASAIFQVGATPVFVDIGESDFTLDTSLIAAAITPRTRAVMPVHLYGLMCDMDPIMQIAEQHGLLVIEDAAQAIGATYRGQQAGRFGPAMFSLYATKNVTSGEGGMATTDDDGLADRLRLYRNHGMRVRYLHESLGTNFKPSDLAAAIGLAQLERIEEANARRRRNAERLSEELAEYITPVVPEGREHAWHQYTMRFPGQRDAVADALRQRGVGTLIYYPVPVHRQAYVAELAPRLAQQALPVTERLAAEVLSVPVRANLTEQELEAVISAIRDVARPQDTAR
jgi:perosamine synthetase